MLRKAAAELIGTFAIVFFGCGSVMVLHRFPGSFGATAVPVIFGSVVAVMVYAVGHISGAHFNPAVTLAFAIGRHFPRREVLAYWIAQLTGALLASLLLSWLLPSGSEYGVTVPHLAIARSFVVEVLLTFFLMFVILAVATDTRAVGMMAGAAIGATVAIAAYFGGPLTGASMNPARSIGPAIVSGNYSALWLYIVAPIVGAAIAALGYGWLRGGPDRKKAEVLNR